MVQGEGEGSDQASQPRLVEPGVQGIFPRPWQRFALPVGEGGVEGASGLEQGGQMTERRGYLVLGQTGEGAAGLDAVIGNDALHLLDAADSHRLTAQARGGSGLRPARIEGGHGEVLLAKEAQILSCPATGLQQMTAAAQQGQEEGMGACHEGGARGGVVRRRGGVWQGCRAHRGGGRYSSRFAPGC